MDVMHTQDSLCKSTGTWSTHTSCQGDLIGKRAPESQTLGEGFGEIPAQNKANRQRKLELNHLLPQDAQPDMEECEKADGLVIQARGNPVDLFRQVESKAVECKNLKSQYPSHQLVKTSEIVMINSDHEGRTDQCISIQSIQDTATQKTINVLSETVNNHELQKKTETKIIQSPNELRELNILKNKDAVYLEVSPAECQKVSLTLNMVTKSRTKLQRLMKFVAPDCPGKEQVRLFMSKQKSALAIVKTGNHITFLIGLGEGNYTNLQNTCINYQLNQQEKILFANLLEKEFENDGLNPDHLYVGVFSECGKFEELIFSKSERKLVSKLVLFFKDVREANSPIVGAHYSPFLKDFNIYPDRIRVTIFTDQPNSVSVYTAVHLRENGPNKGNVVFSEVFQVDKQKYNLTSKVSVSHFEDAYNKLIVYLVPEVFDSVAIMEISHKLESAVVAVDSICLQSNKSDCEKKIDWISPSGKGMMNGIMTLICNDHQVVKHVRRISCVWDLNDIIPPRETHLDRLLYHN